MRNTRSNAMTKRNRAQKFAVGIAIVALLAIIFGTVFAGTLSGAFGIENLQIEKGEISGNVADAVNDSSGVASTSWQATSTGEVHNINTIGTSTNTWSVKNDDDYGIGFKDSGASDGDFGAVYYSVALSQEVKDAVNNGIEIKIKLEGTYQAGGYNDFTSLGIFTETPTNLSTGKDSGSTVIKWESPWYRSDVTSVSWNENNVPSACIAKTGWTDSNKSALSIEKEIPQNTLTIYLALMFVADGDTGCGYKDIKITLTYPETTVSFTTNNANGTVDQTTKTFKSTTDTIDVTATPKTGYHFDKWQEGSNDYTAYSGADSNLLDGSKFTFSGSKVKPNNKYTANFAVNQFYIKYVNVDHKGNDATDTFTWTSGTSAYTLRSPAKSTDDYTFIGWALTADADITYKPGVKAGQTINGVNVSAALNHGKTITLYAKWIGSDYDVLSGKSKTDGTWGSANNPYVISNEQHLKNLSDIVNAVRNPVDSVSGTYYGVSVSTNTNDYDLTYADCYFVVTEDITAGTNFSPIGKDTTNLFSGTFYGGTGVYSGVYSGNSQAEIKLQINRTADHTGLFGYIKNATIENIKITGSVTGGNHTAGLVGSIFVRPSESEYSTTIKHCINEATINGGNSTGGLVGFVNVSNRSGVKYFLTIEDCKNIGTITGSSNSVGGIVGHANNVEMSNCSNSGSVSSSTNHYVGGIVGCVEAKGADTYKSSISNCTNTGTVQGTYGIGGIAGYADKTDISQCKNTATITATGAAGSITGINFGDKDGNGAFLGGIVGYANGSNIVHCYSSGDVKTVNAQGEPYPWGNSNFVGGVVGATNGQVYYCYSNGKIEASSNVGGIVGYVAVGGDVQNCYFDGSLNALWDDPQARPDSDYRALIGYIYGQNEGEVKDCVALPNVSTEGSKTYVQYNLAPNGKLTFDGFYIINDTITLSQDSLKPVLANQTVCGSWEEILTKDIAGVKITMRIGANQYLDTNYKLSADNIISGYSSTTPPAAPNADTFSLLVGGYYFASEYGSINDNDNVTNNTINIGVSALQINLSDGTDSVVLPDDSITYSAQTWNASGVYGGNSAVYGTNAYYSGTPYYGNNISAATHLAGENYHVWIEATINGVVVGVTSNTDYTIKKRELTIAPVWSAFEDGKYIYNGGHQGLDRITIGEGEVQGTDVLDQILNVNESWNGRIAPSGYVYEISDEISGAINVGNYSVTIALTTNAIAQNYEIKSTPENTLDAPNEWTFANGIGTLSWSIDKRDIQVILSWTDTKIEDGVVKYVYNTNAQGVKEIIFALDIDTGDDLRNVLSVFDNNCDIDSSLLNSTEFYISPKQTKNVGDYLFSVQIDQFRFDEETLFRQNYQLRFYKNENGENTPINDLVIDNTVNKSSINGERTFATFEWTISPKTINIGKKFVNTDDNSDNEQENCNVFRYLGTVANNGNIIEFKDDETNNTLYKYYPLSRYEHYFPEDANAYKTPAFVYQGADYALGNFKVYVEHGNDLNGKPKIEVITLVGSGTESGLANKLFKAQFRFLNADGGIIQDWTDVAEIGNISLEDKNSAPQIIALKFESLDGNYQFDTDNDDKNRTIYYTLLISDFGVLTDKERDATWGNKDNPYVINTVEHLVRLSHIVNGAEAWDSIRKNGSTVGFATDNHYTDAYFVVTADIDLSKTQNMMPIGGHNMDGSVNIDHYFSGTFGGVHLVGGHVPYVADEKGIDQIQYDVHKSATLETDEIFTISLHGNMATSSYVGLFGIIKGARIAGLHIQYAVKHDAVFVPQNYRGGVVGLAEGRSTSGGEVSDGNTNIVYSVIENVSVQAYAETNQFVGKDYTGGLIGYAINTQILQYYIDGEGNEQPFTRFVNGAIKGENYVGGIVGYWLINDSEQIGGNERPLAHSANNFYVEGKAFVGSHVGYADASAVNGKLVITPWTTPQASESGVSYSTTVVGKEFFGGLYGAFIGNGYKKNSLQNDADETTLVLNPSYVNGFNIYAASGSTANVVGGLAGYISNVGVKIVKDGGIQMFHFTSKNNTQNMLAGANFVGYFFGIIGENATLENPTDFTDGNIHNIGVSEDHGISGGSFVGGIAGYMSAGAGVYYGSSGTLFGNKIAIVIAGMDSNSIEGTGDYVGGVFGAIGKPDNSVVSAYVNRLSLDSAKTILQNTMSYDSTTLTFGPQTYDFGDSTAQPIGRVANLGDVKGKNYVGGIVGAVFSKARLDFKNPVYTSRDGMGNNLNTPYLNDTGSTGKIEYFNHTRIYNGHQANGTNNYIRITGTEYVGGIAGKLFGEYHELKYIMSRAYIIGSSYVGGIVGEMENGSIENSTSVLPLNNPDGTITSSANCYQGTSYVGGIVGSLKNGTVKNSITTGMKFTGYAATKADVGGIAGAKGQNASVVASWAIYAAESATYSTVPANDIGKFVVLDKSTAEDFVIPKYVDIACMIGLYNFDIQYNHVAVHDTSQVQPDYLTFAAKVPTTGNKQIVFYDGSGTDTQTNNTFAYFKSQNDMVSLRFGAFGANEQDSMIITKTDVVFKNIAPYSGGANTDAGKANAAKGYRAPSASDRYMATVGTAVYGNSQNNISELGASIKFNGKATSTSEKWQVVGHYSNTFTLGGDTPYIIASQKDWDEFAHSVYSGSNNYQGQTVRLMTDSVVINHNGGSHNGKDFSRNGGYNFAGDISLGASNDTYDKSKTFQGTFDGNGHSIGFSYSGGDPRVSAFPNAGGSTVFRNLTIGTTANKTLAGNGANGNWDLAGFVGKPFGAITFTNCVNNVNVTGFRLCAGFTGYSSAETPITMVSCVNNGNITTKQNIEESDWNKPWNQNIGTQKNYPYGTGGLIARTTSSITLESCINTGTITSNAVKVGGLIGRVTNSSGGKTELKVLNCANTGNIYSYGLNPHTSSDKEKSGNVMAESGGLIGEADRYVEATISSSYNTGNVRAYGSIIGGLVGILGTVPDTEKPHSSVANYSSAITNCYNTGAITAGYKSFGGTIMMGSSGYNFNGSDAGGLVGNAVKVTISHSYNTGNVTAYGGIGYSTTWQNRIGGILGEATNANGGCKIVIHHCYNIGEIAALESTDGDTRYGATIVGYMENEESNSSSSKVYVYDSYAVTGRTYKYVDGSKKTDYQGGTAGWIGFNDGVGSSKANCVRTGTMLDNVSQLTTIMQSGGTVRPIHNSVYSSFNNTNWTFIPGCLPQLKVFALDTPNGLSMESVGYGTNQYGEFNATATKAGNDEYPYIMRDGIDLLGLSRLSQAKDTFKGKYIEFANSTNNIFGASAKIDMLTYKYSTPSETTATRTGKSYHLYSMGGAMTEFATWNASNHYYTETGGRAASSSYTTIEALHGVYNFYPIGIDADFAGTISGKQGESGKTTIDNLNVRAPLGSEYHYAALIGEATGANISYINTRGTAICTDTAASAGGIIGRAGSNTTIDHCTTTATIKGHYYAGGIVGYTNGNIRIINCETNDATISGNNSDLAGIVGYAGGSSANAYIDGCVVNGGSINATATTAIYNIGGIIGRSADSVVLNISNCTVGNLKDVAIIGTFNVGGIVGQATQNTRIENCEVGSYARIVFNKGYASGNSIGGIAGKANKNVTFGGKLTFNGTIVNYSSTDIDVSNIGGIVGYMSSGSTFEEGTVVNVGGYIDLANITNQNVSIENIGGVAGYTEGVTFSGNFTVAPRISLTSGKGTNVGGFIGLNTGATAILATGTEIKIGDIGDAISGNISGATAVGGFIGKNDANADFNIAPDSFNGRPYITQSVTIDINGNITGTGDNVGGLVGLNASGEGKVSVQKGTITIGGTVKGQNNVGGIVGNNSKTLELGGSSCTRKDERAGTTKDALEITQQGKVTGINNVGGLIGLLSNGNIISGELSNSGAVEGCIAVGGIIGKFQDGTISGNFTNTGSVKGVANGNTVSASIGGSIGEMDEGAKIDGARKSTKFVNGGTDNATTSADALTAADSASATVEGVNCVGGSIGAMLGTIVGSGELKVQFENHAQVTGANYVGGSIGLLVGTVDYAVFVNDGKMGLTGNAVCSLGGSIGFVGVPNDATLGVGHRAISISNSHFEFDGQIDTTGSSSTTDTGTNAGIGGVIGVIKDGASEIVEKFENNTFYISGNVNAGNLNNVGGVVGLIAANNIKISNMLAYRTEVKGYANVGGIVGATIASGTVIDNAFNVEGNVVGTAKGEGVVLQVGGIIGLAKEDTNASTSYWVKGFNNADLEKADINDLGAFLGKYGNITVDEKLLRTSTSSPTLYIDEAILANPAWEETTQEQEQKETDEDGNEIIVGYITTRTATVSVVLARGTQSTTVTLKRVITTTVSTFEGTTKTETQYTYSVGGNDIVINTEDSEDGTSNDTWNAILDACGYGYKISNEMYVFEKPEGDIYTTGKKNTGWYFAYANDVKITEGENEVDAINTVHNIDANLQYWKHIANAYTADELADAGEELVGSAIIKDGAAVAMGHVYATAKKGNNGYYLYVATSNKDVLPKITADNDDTPSLFYIDVFANSTDAQAGNIAIYYKLLEIATSIKYNGYDRHVPIKNNDLQYGERSGYYYTVENGGETQHFKNVGTYGGSVAVYYKTATATYEFGGVATTEWKIVAKEITVVNSSLNGTYGGANNVTTITADGIAQPDKDNFVFVVKIDNVEYKLRPVASGAFEVYDVEANEWKSSIEYNAGKNITFESFNIEESKSYSKNDKSYSVYGASGAKWQKAVLKIRFSKAKRYELGFGYDGQFGDETSTQKNYTLKSTVSSVNVKPKLLNISIDSNRASAVYDGKEHNTSWMITGWENNEKLSTSYEGKTYEQLFGITAYYAEANSTNYTATSKVAISYNSNANEVYMQNAKDAGSYTLHFGENVKKSTNTYTVGNYYFKVDTSTAADRKGLDNNKQAQPFIIGVTKIVVTKSDSPSNHVYDGNPGKITFTFSVEDMSGKKLDIADYIDIINGYYNATVDKGSPTPTFNVSKKNNNEASVTFDTGVNAETYTATLTLKNNIDATQKANCLPYDNGKDIKQSHTISKRKLSLTFNMMSGEPYTYDTQHHGLNSVSVNSASGNVGLISGDTVTLNLSVTNGKGWNTSKNGYTPGSGGALGIITSDTGTYTATVSLNGSGKDNKNYELSGTTSCTWTINKKDLTMSVESGDAVYDGTEHFPTVSLEGLSGNNYGADTITFGYKIKDNPDQKIVNAGTYNLTCDSTDLVVKRGSSTTGANGIALVDNYNITGGGASTFTVSPAPLTVSWTNNTLIYNGKAQGQVLAGASSNGKTFTVSNGNVVNAFEGDVITFTLSGQEINATNAGENYQMTASATSLTNAQRPTSVLGNYTITIPECVYNIEQAPVVINVVSITGVSGVATEKVYDATNKVLGTPSVSWTSPNGGVTPQPNEYTVTVVYDSADVGNRKINYTVSELNGNYKCELLNGSIDGRITPLQLTVELDRLRGDKATKTFDDSISYGGAGFEGNSAGRSRTYRIGEGFSVSGFPSGGSSIKIVAEFKEAEQNREEFDAYINNIVQNGTEFSVDKDAKHYKKLVFTMSGEKAGNYTFVVVRGGTTLATSSNGSATVFDKDDTANVGSGKATSNISIEITVAQLKASYGNTAQSYANADNTYNTKWEAVTATSGVSGLDIAVVNGWMTENGQPKVYDKYTVIRGRENSTQLSASITKDANGKYINYRLSNQPILTIGYFVSGDEFEIGSLASLMIATYYQYAAQHGEDGNFNPVISSIATWVSVVSNADYENPDSFDAKKPIDAGECTSWDAYFATKEEKEGINIFLNAFEGDVWGYYKEEEGKAPTQYKSYKQVANVSGIMTESDITILNNFFVAGETATQKQWGVGGDYIQNFVNVGVGNVIIAIGSLFGEDFGTEYSYDGNGYTINHVNIINYTDNANVGMFANVNGGTIKNVNLRNFSIVSNGSGNVGGIVATGSNATLVNSTFHGSITVNGNANVGGLIGSGNMGVEGAIVLGNIDAIGTANVGGVIGVADGNAINNVVSMIEVYADGNVGAIVGTGSVSASSNQVFYLANSAWHRKVGENNPIIANSNYGTSKTYTELFNGSISGYGSTKYYTQDAKFGAYDVVKNIVDIDEAVHAPRESMNLRDIVDVYLLMYSLSEYTLNETSGQKAYAISASSWLVGNKHGTDANDAIVIANQQGVALLRELRFATFTLANDVEMYSTHSHSVFDGVFYGTIIANGHKIYLQGANAMFEYTVNALPIEQKKA